MTLGDSLKDFPTHQASVATALVVILLTGIVVIVKLALGDVFPDGYDTWIWALIALAGVNVAGLGVKRFSDYGREAIRQGASLADVQQFRDTGTAPVQSAPVPAVEKQQAATKYVPGADTPPDPSAG